MPNRAPTACTTPRCPHPSAGGPCPSCRKKADRARGTAAQRGYGGAWKAIRLLVLARDVVCQCSPECEEPLTRSDDVDHIMPLPIGTNDLSNLRGMKHGHHSTKTIREDGGLGYARRQQPQTDLVRGSPPRRTRTRRRTSGA